MRPENEIPEDLVDLLEASANTCASRHREARGELRNLVESQNRQLADVEARKQELLRAVREAGRTQAAACQQQKHQRIAVLQNEITSLPRRVSPRRSWLLIFERDNENYHEERARIERELSEARESLAPALEEIRQKMEAVIAQAQDESGRVKVQLMAQQDATLRSFEVERNRETLEIESAVEALGSFARTVPERSDGTTPLVFARTGSIRYELTRWNEAESEAMTMPWLHGVKRDKGLVVSGSGDSMSWLHSWIFGMMGAFPPGLLRLTLMDPAQLGRPFSRWLELGDSSANLLGGKIWTEIREIETRLSEMKEHVVRVTQRLLRDEFADLHAYNAAHPEASEPFHLMVIHQPAGGWRGSIPELISQIFINGPRCGVIPCVLLPSECGSVPMALESGGFQSLSIGPDGGLAGTMLGLDHGLFPVWQPDPECGSMKPAKRLREIGDEAARRTAVSVDYEGLLKDSGLDRAQAAGRDTAEGLVLPLGRSETGAILRLELGTAAGHHHVLIGGRPGSGKSTLVHAIVTTACRLHGPQELQVYLLDYKRGTEFMPYASEQLPQARVISVESDREFGCSVLRFIDSELERRSKLFKRVNAQDLPEYRRLSGDILPRMLLVIDEFQVLFSGKDSLADGASHMLDQLIRQGRSYGLHIILATQALTSGWSLSANTLSQISVRIAMACDDRVSRQILGEDNKGAQLLTRPGEAIYNDQNGQPLGNHRFQVVHFRRENLGEQVREIIANYGRSTDECIVFDGSSLPDGASGHTCDAESSGDTIELVLGVSSEMGRSARIHLENRHGQNLILFSDNREMRHRHLHSILESIKTQGVETILVDAAVGGSAIASRQTDHRTANFMDQSKLAELLVRLRAELGQGGRHPSAEFLGKILILHSPQNLPELRSDPIQALGNSAGNSAAADFEWLLRHGPALGMHCILLAERPSSLIHAIDPRSRLLELFDLRIATRMAEDESRKAMPDAGAARLGEMDALLYYRSENACMKFRPFEWFDV